MTTQTSADQKIGDGLQIPSTSGDSSDSQQEATSEISGAWTPPGDSGQKSPNQLQPPPTTDELIAGKKGRRKGKIEIKGTASHVSVDVDRNSGEQVLRLRLQPDDDMGGAVSQLQIEMRASDFKGSIPADGDKIWVKGKFSKELVVNAKQLVNLTTGARVEAKKPPMNRAALFFLMLGLIVLVIFIVLVVSSGG